MEYIKTRIFNKKQVPALEKGGWHFVRDINDQMAEMEREDQFKVRTLRDKREILFKAFDIFKTNLAVGIETITSDEWETILNWYKLCKDLDEEAINNPPEKVKEYLK